MSDAPAPPLDEPVERDEAQESLADALRLSFALLRALMVLLLGYFGFSGLYSVQEGTVVVHLRLGQILGEPGQQTRTPGGPYFAMPAPIDRTVVVPTGDRQIILDEAFWFRLTDRDKLAESLDDIRVPEGGLVPGEDGALLTGDQNIVHGRWQVNFRIRAEGEGAVDFVRTFGAESTAGGTLSATALRAIRYAAERGIVRTVAGTTADDYLSASFDRDAAKRAIQQALDALAEPRPDGAPPRCGLLVTQVLLRQPTPPLRVRASFQEKAQAESEKAQQIEDAKRQAARTLNEVAGQDHVRLLEAIAAFEAARRANDADAVAAAEARIGALLKSDTVGGTVAERLREAETYRTQTVELLRTEADLFNRLLPRYRDNPRIVYDFLWHETMWTVFGGDVEKFYVPAGAKQLYIELSRDPQVARERVRKQFEAERQKNKQAEEAAR